MVSYEIFPYPQRNNNLNSMRYISIVLLLCLFIFKEKKISWSNRTEKKIVAYLRYYTRLLKKVFLFFFWSCTWLTLQLPAITIRPACTCVKTSGDDPDKMFENKLKQKLAHSRFFLQQWTFYYAWFFPPPPLCSFLKR